MFATNYKRLYHRPAQDEHENQQQDAEYADWLSEEEDGQELYDVYNDGGK